MKGTWAGPENEAAQLTSKRWLYRASKRSACSRYSSSSSMSSASSRGSVPWLIHPCNTPSLLTLSLEVKAHQTEAHPQSLLSTSLLMAVR